MGTTQFLSINRTRIAMKTLVIVSCLFAVAFALPGKDRDDDDHKCTPEKLKALAMDLVESLFFECDVDKNDNLCLDEIKNCEFAPPKLKTASRALPKKVLVKLVMRMMKKLTPKKVAIAIMKFSDANGDRKLDFEEAQKTIKIVFGHELDQAEFDEVDENGDKFIDVKELAHFIQHEGCCDDHDH